MIFYEEIPWIVQNFQPMTCSEARYVEIAERVTKNSYFKWKLEECPFEIIELIQNLEHSKPLEGDGNELS